MKHLRLWAIVALLVVLIIVLATRLSSNQTSLSFSVCDSVTKEWVWDMTATIQDKTIKGFFQSDNGIITYRFTNLKKKKSILSISAPGYETVSVPLDLKKGDNIIDTPIELKGLEITGLAGFYAFEEADDEKFKITLRPVSENNYAIKNHPALPIWIGARIKDWKSNLPTTLEVFDTQPLLYKGELEWDWDSYPESQFRYIASLPYSHINQIDSEAYAIEYLIVIPNLTQIDENEFNSITESLVKAYDDDIGQYLHSIDNKISYYTDISYNVKAIK